MAAELTKKSTSLGIELLQIGTSFSFCAEQNLATPRFPAHSESLKKWVIDICDKALPFLREDLGSSRACWDHPCIVRLLLVGALEHLDYFSHHIGYIGNNMIIIPTDELHNFSEG